MKKLILLAGAAMMAACSPAAEDEAAPAEEVTEDASMEAAGDTSLLGTTWTFTDPDGNEVIETIDADGNYIADSTDGAHLDHGTMRMVDGQGCFTSAMNDEGEICWTIEPHNVGETQTTVGSNGDSLDVTRVEYTELSMPGG
ncbi:hypothetical protein [Sphingomicrobium sediminis]|uniref:Lipoprotein n=1 Tax=Sphingomicrobium sediminis TaxID=2950949 RepID=A0A9X2EKY2_9SPHN|nr:hypothetical protein [Sphingomicrobium sediminis]MCM8557297.1 hypothetical protein [Sphingomicrobium sediminis]